MKFITIINKFKKIFNFKISISKIVSNRMKHMKKIDEKNTMTIDKLIMGVRQGDNSKRVCWDINKRGAVGETPLHLCFLNATNYHMDLAKRMLKLFPRLIDDIYMSDEYYGN